MWPTPDTSHVAFDRIYEPAEDSYLLLDTLSSNEETAFLCKRFSNGLELRYGNMRNGSSSNPPLVVEIGTGSGVVLAFVTAHGFDIFGRFDVLTLGIDINPYACTATQQTVTAAVKSQMKQGKECATYIGNMVGDLTSPILRDAVDVLIFNPPYVPTSELPELPKEGMPSHTSSGTSKGTTYEDDSKYLELSYAGGEDGMETTSRLLEQLPLVLSKQGVAYILLCAQNKPEAVKAEIKSWGNGWKAETVGSSGKKAGWEKLVIIRIARVAT